VFVDKRYFEMRITTMSCASWLA